MQPFLLENIITDKLSIPILTEKKVSIDVLRLDKIHPIVSGNKWFKLRYYIEDAKNKNKKTILTFGGAWSNHIIATAAICNISGFESIGIIRGEEAYILSPTLLHAKELGMKLFFISRSNYQGKKIPAELDDEDIYIIDEGGMGEQGVAGAATIADLCEFKKYSHICCASGTGTMAAGLLIRTAALQQIVAISVLKNYLQMDSTIRSNAGQYNGKLSVSNDYHFGGYAKHNTALLDFMNHFYQQTSIPTDFVYTGKLCYAIMDMVQQNLFPENSKLLLIHSGGLQGNASLSKRTLIF